MGLYRYRYNKELKILTSEDLLLPRGARRGARRGEIFCTPGFCLFCVVFPPSIFSEKIRRFEKTAVNVVHYSVDMV